MPAAQRRPPRRAGRSRAVGRARGAQPRAAAEGAPSRCCRSGRSARKAGCGDSSRSRRAASPGRLDEFWPDVGPNERVARRHRRELGARARTTSTGWCRSPTCSRTRALIAKAQRYVEWTLTTPGRERLARPDQQHRLVAEHGDAEGADAVPGGHRRSARRARAHPLLRASRRRSRRSGRCTTGPSIAGPTSWPRSSGSSTAPPIRGCSIWRAR